MPEGPEVRRIVDKLREKVRGLSLLWINLFRLEKLSANHKELINNWNQLKFPAICLDIISRGKQIYFFFDNGIVFNSGLGLEGHWYIDSPDQYTDFGLVFGDYWINNNTEVFVEKVTLFYDDKIRYGNLYITTWNTSINKMMTEYGPDFLNVKYPQKDIHPQVQSVLPSSFFIPPQIENFWFEITQPRRTNMAFCEFILTNQKIFSGVGNWILNEVCYHAQVHPARPCGLIQREEADRLFNRIVQIISLGYESGGLTFGTYLDPYKQKGRYQVTVYRRDGQLDPNGFLIIKVPLPNKRSGYIVPQLQP